MLFALDWMKDTWDTMITAFGTLIEGVDLLSISEFINSFWLILTLFLAAGMMLCFWGFRYHKFVHGTAGAILFGNLGWAIGRSINAGQVTTAAIYAVVMVIVGFFVMYLCYYMNVFAGSWLLFLAAFTSFGTVTQESVLLVTAILAVIYCALYIKYKVVLTAVTGGAVLGLAFFCRYSILAAVIFCVCMAAGIYVQILLKKRYEDQKEWSRREQIEKYPYGPGTVYGWHDPTIFQRQKKKEKIRKN